MDRRADELAFRQLIAPWSSNSFLWEGIRNFTIGGKRLYLKYWQKAL